MMESKEIVEGSKLIAEYLGWRYIPSNDLQGYSCPGWWKVSKPVWGDDGLGEMMLAQTKDHKSKLGQSYYVCRKHADLRFWNDCNLIIRVIEKIQNDEKIEFFLYKNGGKIKHSKISNFNKDYTWCQNLFIIIIEFLKNEKRRP